MYAMEAFIKVLVTVMFVKVVIGTSISWDSACGSTKGCFPDCTGGCEYLVTWQDTGSNINFELKAVESDTNVYLAMAFSDDLRMGDDSVAACIVPGSSVQSWYNDGLDSDVLSPSTLGITSVVVSQSNGIISCSFTRSYSESSDDRFFDLKNDYRLMLVVGDAESEGSTYKIGDHSKIPWTSDGKVDFNSHTIVSEYKLNSSLVKLHGIMMMLAWLLFSTVGIITARYNKDLLHEKKVFGAKIWFTVHRACMVVVLLFVVIGFIAIFVELSGYSQIITEGIVASHPVLGIIVTVLTILNPIGALLRPGPDHKLRWLFYWGHFGAGVIAQVLAVVTMFFGLVLDRSDLPTSAIYVMIIPLLIIIAVCVILEVHKWKKGKGQAKSEDKKEAGSEMEIKERPVDSQPSKFPTYVLLAFIIVMFAFAMALLGIIAAS